MDKKGKIFVIDGIDGSGKQTQTQLLAERLRKENIEFMQLSFPRYENPSSSLVKMYLNGDFGSNPEDVNAYASSSFYALDRYASYKQDYGEFYENGGIIIADRYTTSNMVHQAGKIEDKEEKEKFLDWLFEFEYNILGIPQPDMVLFLNMPYEYSAKLMKDRENKITHGDKKDIQESNEEHLRKSHKNASELAQKFGWKEINCVKNGEIRTIEDIHNEIFQIVRANI